ncbi:hypothetical protein PPL_05523 [Heterostelium album PN500]|uniref:Ankyrin repeat protein n=1 Tax=Heterostelium pallidum (strain ATCC 26659 / Pp 5 / PN500) TaxID=670386 RepID=D3BAE7_HETP5|nr:hypothetical protein PPL_05523 [Heterostelium album PN500]EFA81534.1 hypothetical protein PPL_05523 [Heterostelium album PN500]|eukprot:XP_020433651.1 hypothetical protein PPL_05523 [Heterostelium album PN500]
MSINNLTNTLFSKVFNNTVIRNEIFQKVYSVNKQWAVYPRPTKVHRYNQLLVTPKALIGNDYLDLLIQYHQKQGFTPDANEIAQCFVWAVSYQRLGILQYLCGWVSKGIDEEIREILLECRLMSTAAGQSNIEMLEWMYQNNALEIFQCSSVDYRMLPGLPNGFNTMKWIRSNLHLELEESVVGSAAGSGNLEVLSWVLENYEGEQPIDWAEVATSVVIGEHVHILEWINQHHRPSDEQLANVRILVYNMCGNKRSDTIDWIHKNWTAVNFNHNYDYVAKDGSLELIRWIHENLSETNTKPVFTVDAMTNAAQYNSLEVCEFLLNNRTEGCNGWTVHNAAINGRKAIVDLILSKGFDRVGLFSFTVEETQRRGYPEIADLLKAYL